MTKTLWEALLFASVAINAALLIFFSGVFRQMVDALDAATFKSIIDMFVRFSKKSAFMIIILNLPLLIAIPYYYRFGFDNRYITGGLILWLAAGSVSKFIKLPVYNKIAALPADATAELMEARKKMNTGNILQAVLYSAATIIMLFGLL